MEENPLTVPQGIPILEVETEPPVSEVPEILIITGMSGAGRSRAAHALEDLDWYVVDNLPPRLLLPMAKMMTAEGEGIHRLAAVVDVRSGEFFHELISTLDELRAANIDHRIIFLECDEDVLVRRYESVRRPHPLQGDGRVLDGIRQEKRILDGLRLRSDTIIDTTNMSVHDLARKMRETVAGESDKQIRITVMSFGFKHGLPLDADHVVDMRFLANPYWVTELRHLTGLDKPVSDYVLSLPGASNFVENYANLLTPIMDGYMSELKPFVTIAVGCTGGRHRSVATAERLSQLLRERGLPVRTIHRDVGRE